MEGKTLVVDEGGKEDSQFRIETSIYCEQMCSGRRETEVSRRLWAIQHKSSERRRLERARYNGYENRVHEVPGTVFTSSRHKLLLVQP